MAAAVASRSAQDAIGGVGTGTQNMLAVDEENNILIVRSGQERDQNNSQSPPESFQTEKGVIAGQIDA